MVARRYWLAPRLPSANRQVEDEEKAQRAQEQQRRILEQVRQETLSRMRAEMVSSVRRPRRKRRAPTPSSWPRPSVSGSS